MNKNEQLEKYERYIQVMASNLTNNDYIKEELIQEGRIALSKAFDNFIEGKGAFKTYMISYVKGAMKNYLSDYSRTIRIPQSVSSPSNPYYDKEKQEQYFKVRTIDINSTINGNEDGFTILETILIPDEDNELDDTQELTRARLRHELTNLKEQYQKIIKMRYTQELTFLEIGEQLGISPQAVKQQHNIAITKLRDSIK